MKQKIIAANWKMHGGLQRVQDLLAVSKKLSDTYSSAKIVLFPPTIYLPLCETTLNDSKVCWGSQNVYPGQEGAFTGEVSAAMLAEFGCSYVLVGHSERRTLFQESNALVAEKFVAAQAVNLIPMLCIGESLAEKEAGETEIILQQQLSAIFKHPGYQQKQAFCIAYEPIWAIGTGKTATPENVQVVHAWIRSFIGQYHDAPKTISILYGGSVKGHNARPLLEQLDVDGLLVGGASLIADEFLRIIECSS